MDAIVADFFGILTHNHIKSHVCDGSRHLDRCCASFYNDALLDMGKALVQRARGRLRASRSPKEIGGIQLVNQGGGLIARALSSRRFFHLTAEMTAKSWSAPIKFSRLPSEFLVILSKYRSFPPGKLSLCHLSHEPYKASKAS